MAFLPEIKAIPNRIGIKGNNYTCLINILGILGQETKDLGRPRIFVFRIKVNINVFTIDLARNTFYKMNKFKL